MKLLLFILTISCFAFLSTAQYKDSLKTFRKCVKKYQKSSDYRLIPSGSYVRGTNDSDLPTPQMNGYYFRSHTISVDSFFMGKFEISNEKYLEFVNDKIKQDSISGKNFLPDTLVWRSPNWYNEPYVEYYLRHPAYANYPVVGVSYTQAKAYAEWLSSKYNENSERVFKKVRFRIPTEEEWEYASKGKRTYSYLPWEAPSTLDENGKPRANFRAISQLGVFRDTILIKDYKGEQIHTVAYLSNGMRMEDLISGNLYDNDVTAPVDAFEPNQYGLYQMAGNVAEMVDAYYFRSPDNYAFTQDILKKYDQPWGVTKGGSWSDTGYYLQYPVRQFYENEFSASAEMGFRLVMEVLDY